MLIMVSYDIADDKRRNKVAKCLEDHGKRVQWSVFDCLLDERQLMKLQRKLHTLIDHEIDSVRFYRLCAKCRDSVMVMGAGTLTEDQNLVLI